MRGFRSGIMESTCFHDQTSVLRIGEPPECGRRPIDPMVSPRGKRRKPHYGRLRGPRCEGLQPAQRSTKPGLTQARGRALRHAQFLLCGRMEGVIERYTLPEMGRVWSEAHKYELWCQVETLVLEAHAR